MKSKLALILVSFALSAKMSPKNNENEILISNHTNERRRTKNTQNKINMNKIVLFFIKLYKMIFHCNSM